MSSACQQNTPPVQNVGIYSYKMVSTIDTSKFSADIHIAQTFFPYINSTSYQSITLLRNHLYFHYKVHNYYKRITHPLIIQNMSVLRQSDKQRLFTDFNIQYTRSTRKRSIVIPAAVETIDTRAFVHIEHQKCNARTNLSDKVQECSSSRHIKA